MGANCTWCGAEIEADDGFRVYEAAGDRHALFCRLEHVVPWAIQGARFDPGAPPGWEPGSEPQRCSHCDAELEEVRVELIRHRGAYRVRDDFCSADHLAAWAKAGGRWQS